jgi:hypothetical protein
VSETFHEIYEGVSGELRSSRFEVDFHASATPGRHGSLGVDVSGWDQSDADATYWTVSGIASYFEWFEFSGPPDPSGNYVISFEAHLGTFFADNIQLGGLPYLWKGNASTRLDAVPLDTNFSELHLGTSAQLKQDCPSMAQPACWQIPRTTFASGQVSVPEANPVLRVSHYASVLVRTAEADLSSARFSMLLPAGVSATQYQPVPEPDATLLTLAACAALVRMRRLHWLASKQTATADSSSHSVAR